MPRRFQFGLKWLMALVAFAAFGCMAAAPLANAARYMWDQFTEGPPLRGC